MLKRKRIGSINSLSPAQKIRRMCVGFVAKLLFCVFFSFLTYVIFKYLIFGIVNFLSEKVLEAGAIPEDNRTFRVVMIVFIILVNVYIIRDKVSKR